MKDGYVPMPFESLEAWLSQLDELERRWPGVAAVYMGHGMPGPAAAKIAAGRAYLSDLRAAVSARVADEALSADEAGAVAFDLEAKYPFWHGVGGTTPS